jgi:hypothetical protein
MSEQSRRDLLRNVALSVSLGGLSAEAAQHVHEHAQADKQRTGGVYKPKLFTDHEYKTLQSLAETVIPGATKGGAADFIDLLASQSEEMASIFTGGLSWLDLEMKRRFQKDYLSASAQQQTSLLDLIAYKKNDGPELGPGIRFFSWVRRLAADAYYTSKAGIEEVGYKGNVGMTEYKVPQEAYDYALKRAGMA